MSFHYDPDLDDIFFFCQDTLANDDALPHYIWLQKGSEDITHTDIQQCFEPSLWPWPWTQQRSFHKTLWFVMMYHQAEFGNQWIRSSKEVTETVTWALWPWPWRQQPIFFHDAMDYNDISPYQVWLWKAQWFRTYHPDKYWLKLWMFAVTLTVNTAVQYYMAYDDLPSNLVWLQKNH